MQLRHKLYLLLAWLALLSLEQVCAGKFTQDFLKTINTYRRNHKAPKVEFVKQLTTEAQEMAEKSAESGKFPNEPGRGKNTFMLCTTYNRALPASEVVTAWYNEVCNEEMDFKFDNVNNTLAFTQLVWSSSQSVGLGRKTVEKDEDGKKFCTFVVALFSPPGNVIEAGTGDKAIFFRENVKKANNTKAYCKKLAEDEVKRKKRSTDHHMDSFDHHSKNYKRSLYYRFPAKFYIDPLTGVPRAISPETEKAQVKSLLGTANPYSRQYQMGYPQQMPYSTNSMYPEIMNQGYTYPYQQIGGATTFAQQPVQDNRLYYSQPYNNNNNNNAATTSSIAASASTATHKVAKKKDSPGNMETWQQTALKVHNKLRQEVHQSSPLKWDTALAKAAEDQAKINAGQGSLQHPPDLGEIGENLAYNCKQSVVAPVEESISDWYDEICNSTINFPITDANSKGVLHFSQVVWVDTKLLGCGRAVKEQMFSNSTMLKCTYYCCRYSLAGNVKGEFERNVKRGAFSQDETCSSLPQLMEEAKQAPLDLSAIAIASDSASLDPHAQQAPQNIYQSFGSFGIPKVPKMPTKIRSMDSLEEESQLVALLEGEVSIQAENGNFWTAVNRGYNRENIEALKSEVDGSSLFTLEKADKDHVYIRSKQNGKYLSRIHRGIDYIEAGKSKPDVYCKFKVIFLGKFVAFQADTGKYLSRVHRGGRNNIEPLKTTIDPYCKFTVEKPDKIRQEALMEHNKNRDVHMTPPLKLDDELNEQASKWAKEISELGELKHSSVNIAEFGENLWFKCSPEEKAVSGSEFVNDWYDEVCRPKHYDFDKDIQTGTMHFTQVVWFATRKLGIGVATKKQGNQFCTYIVGQYKPKGNILGNFQKNVKKGKFDFESCNKDKPSEADKPISEGKLPKEPEESKVPPPAGEAKPPADPNEPLPPSEGKPMGTEGKPPGAGEGEEQPAGGKTPAEGKPPADDTDGMAQPDAESPLEPNKVTPEGQTPPGMQPKPGQKTDANGKPPTEGKPPVAANPNVPVEGKPPGTQSGAVPPAEGKPPGTQPGAVPTEGKPPGTQPGANLNAPSEGKPPGTEGKPPGGSKLPGMPKNEGKPPGMPTEGKPPVTPAEGKPPGAEGKPPGATNPLGTEAKPPGVPGAKPPPGTAPPGTQPKPPGAEAKPPGTTPSGLAPPGTKGKPPGAAAPGTAQPDAEAKPPGSTPEDQPPPAVASVPETEGKPPGTPPTEGKPPGAVPDAEAKPPGVGVPDEEKPETSESPAGAPGGAAPNPAPPPEEQKPGEEVSQEQQDQDEKNFQDDSVKVMNAFRKIHGAPPAVSSRNLGEQAKQVANQYARGVHRRAIVPGEMVQVTCNPADRVLPPEEAVTNWYNELCNKPRDFNQEGVQGGMHVTQLLWAATEETGWAYSTKKKSGALCTVVVAKMFPPGNIAGKFVQNVKKGTFDKSFCGSIFNIAIASLETPGGEPEVAKQGSAPPTPGGDPAAPEEEAKAVVSSAASVATQELVSLQQQGFANEKSLGASQQGVPLPPPRQDALYEVASTSPVLPNLAEADNSVVPNGGSSNVTPVLNSQENQNYAPVESPPPVTAVSPENTAKDQTNIEAKSESTLNLAESTLNLADFDKTPSVDPAMTAPPPVTPFLHTRKPQFEPALTTQKPQIEPEITIQQPQIDPVLTTSIQPPTGAPEITKKQELTTPQPLVTKVAVTTLRASTTLVNPSPDGTAAPEEDVDYPEQPQPTSMPVVTTPIQPKPPVPPSPPPGQEPGAPQLPEDTNPSDAENTEQGKPPPMGAEAKPPGAEAKPLGAEAKPPGAEAKPPGVEAKPAGDEAKLPGAEAKPPGTKPPPDEKPTPDPINLPDPAEPVPPPEPKPPEEPKAPVEPKPPTTEAKPGENPVDAGKPAADTGAPAKPLSPSDGLAPSGDEAAPPLQPNATPPPNTMPGENNPKPPPANPSPPPPPGGKSPPPGQEGKPPEAPPTAPGQEAKPPGSPKPPGQEGKPPPPPGQEGKPPGAPPTAPGQEAKPPGSPKPPGQEGKHPPPPGQEGKPPGAPPTAPGQEAKPPGSPKPPGQEGKPPPPPGQEGKPPGAPPTAPGQEAKPPGSPKPPGQEGKPPPPPGQEDKPPAPPPPPVIPEEAKSGEEAKGAEAGGEEPQKQPEPGELPKNPGEDEAFSAGSLKAANALRSVHGASLLKPDPDLSKRALELASTIGKAVTDSKAKKDSMSATNFGFNMYQECFVEEGKKVTPDDAILKWWGDAFCDGNALVTKVMSPGTQLVWEKSTSMGMARTSFKVKEETCDTVVCLFSPKGNVQGEFAENVKAGDFDPDVMCEDKNNTLQVAFDLLENSPEGDQQAGEENPAENPEPPQPAEGATPPGQEGKPSAAPGQEGKPPAETPPPAGEEQPAQPKPESPDATSAPPGGEGDEQKPPAPTTPAPSQGQEGKPPAPPQPPGPEAKPPGTGEEAKPPAGNEPPKDQEENEEKSFAQQGLEAHNILRKIHGVPDLQIDEEMNQQAASYAQIIADKQTLVHSTVEERQQDGENLAYACSSGDAEYKAAEPVQQWYEEVCSTKYTFTEDVYMSDAGHFTQLVWKASTKLGMGFATKKQGDMTCSYAVARYRPAGNMEGQFLQNVLQGTFTHEQTCPSLTPLLKLKAAKRSISKVGKPLKSRRSELRSRVGKSPKHPHKKHGSKKTLRSLARKLKSKNSSKKTT